MSKCWSCGAAIVWVETTSGKTMPIDAATAKPGDTKYDSTRHKSHFATCPNANHHRKPR